MQAEIKNSEIDLAQKMVGTAQVGNDMSKEASRFESAGTGRKILSRPSELQTYVMS